MVSQERKLPIGIQSFEEIIQNHHVYVDKTEYVYHLVHTNLPYLLCRPRRFGKSLLLSTLKAYWEGRKELFAGLKIEALEQGNPDAWQSYPVFYLDFNQAHYAKKGVLEDILEVHLQAWEKTYGSTSQKVPLGARFGQLLRAAAEQAGRKCVVLVDEYDKPLLEAMENKDLVEHNMAVFRGFFSALKSEDANIQFVFITGVTKFSKMSIFSDLNQLREISMSMDYAQICGITEQDMCSVFMPEIKAMADEQGLTVEACLKMLKTAYDGYHFHQKGTSVYNPYSLLNALSDREIEAYWFETGTPSFLVKQLKAMNFDPRKFTDGTLYAIKSMLRDFQDDQPDPIPLLYQTGYLTLVNYDSHGSIYTLGFPNDEVKYGFLDSLMPMYTGSTGAGSGKDILSLRKYVQAGDLEGIRGVFKALFAGIPYPANDVPFEHDFQSVIFITMTLLGHYIHCEQHTSMGRIDCVVETENYVYLFAFKRDGDAKAALQQIEDMHYADPYAADPRKLFKIGVNFHSETRQIEGWEEG